MVRVLLAGAGTIGQLIGSLLANSGDYQVFAVDKDQHHLNSLLVQQNIHPYQLDITDKDSLENFLKQHQIQATISSLPYFYNLHIAKAAAKMGCHYFDLTEDVAVANEVQKLSQQLPSAFVSQCGVAPGFINIVANDLMQHFESLHEANLRAGCLPVSCHNSLQYAITWSLDGLINEYGNVCYGLIEGQKVALQPLEDLETVEIDSMVFEAFNTSGGVGSLLETYRDKINILNYKTLRYPGHCEKMRFLMMDLGLNEDRATLKKILEKSLPKTDQDVVVLYVAVSGLKNNEFFEKSYTKKIYPKTLFNKTWSAIQICTASSLCAVVDLVMQNSHEYHGFILQEQFSLPQFLANRFGKIFA